MRVRFTEVKYLAIAAFILGSISSIGALFLYALISPKEHRSYSMASEEPQSEVNSQYRFRSIADGSYQVSSPTPMREAYLKIKEFWWNSERIPNLCYQIENIGIAASSHYSIEIYRGSLEMANILFKTKPRGPLQAGQSVGACMAVPNTVQGERESVLLAAKEIL